MAQRANIAQTAAQMAHTVAESGWLFDLVFAGLALLIFALIIVALWRTGLKDALGMKGFPSWAFVLAAGFWLLVFSLLVAGIIVAIPKIALHEPPASGNKEELWNWRFLLLTLTALTATLGAVLALPITLYRLRLRRRQAEIADEALFNDKIKAAADDLHARRQVTKTDKDGKPYDAWEDDVVRRIAAIDRLYGLAEERPEEAPRIANMLSSYVRELTKEHPPQEPPENASPEELREWARNLEPCRPDMKNAAQVLGRLQKIEGVNEEEVQIDLRGANLQAFGLVAGVFNNANLSGAHLQGVNLMGANLQQAVLNRAQMQGTTLMMANLLGAFFIQTQLQGADLTGARLEWADFNLARTTGSALKNVDCRKVKVLTQEQLNEMFGDGSVILPDHLQRPDFWPKEDLDWDEFRTRWHAWRKERGYDTDSDAD